MMSQNRQNRWLAKSYEAPKSNLPSVFRDMKYADYQQIQFNHDKAYWQY
jgi:glucans biosynthesis protein